MSDLNMKPSGLTEDLYNALQKESQTFVDLCLELIQLHLKKAADYGSAGRPLGNFNEAQVLGIEPLDGVLIRMSDKWARIGAFRRNGKLENELFEDSLIDLAAYSLLAVVVHRRPHGPK